MTIIMYVILLILRVECLSQFELNCFRTVSTGIISATTVTQVASTPAKQPVQAPGKI